MDSMYGALEIALEINFLLLLLLLGVSVRAPLAELTSLTMTQFCTLLKTVLFCRAYITLA